MRFSCPDNHQRLPSGCENIVVCAGGGSGDVWAGAMVAPAIRISAEREQDRQPPRIDIMSVSTHCQSCGAGCTASLIVTRRRIAPLRVSGRYDNGVNTVGT